MGAGTVRRRWRRAVFAALAVTALLILALMPVYSHPRTDAPRPADAILVLGGAHDGREELGLQLARDGYAPRVLISDPYEYSPMVNRICHGGYSFEVICFDPQPRTTRGEGQAMARMARAAGWQRIIVVTFTPHVARSRYILGSCWDGELLFVDHSPPLSPYRWAWNYGYQSAGFVKAAVLGC